MTARVRIRCRQCRRVLREAEFEVATAGGKVVGAHLLRPDGTPMPEDPAEVRVTPCPKCSLPATLGPGQLWAGTTLWVRLLELRPAIEKSHHTGRPANYTVVIPA